MSLYHAVSSDLGEQVRDCQTSRAPDGGFTIAATSTECSQTQDLVKPGSPQLMFSGRRQSSLSRTKPPPAAMPRMDLTHNIPLHSPTPIVGTPFDVNTNFEYPFPPDQDHPSSSNIPSPASRPPSTGSHHLLSSSPPPHIVKSISPPPVSAGYTYSPAHPKMRPREPPIPPGLITKRRRMSESRSASNDSISASSDAIGDVSPVGWGYATSRSADSLPEQSSFGIRERKKDREVIGDGSVDLSRSVRINEAEAVDAAAIDRRENERRHGDNTLVSSSQAILESER